VVTINQCYWQTVRWLRIVSAFYQSCRIKQKLGSYRLKTPNISYVTSASNPMYFISSEVSAKTSLLSSMDLTTVDWTLSPPLMMLCTVLSLARLTKIHPPTTNRPSPQQSWQWGHILWPVTRYSAVPWPAWPMTQTMARYSESRLLAIHDQFRTTAFYSLQWCVICNFGYGLFSEYFYSRPIQ